MEYLTGLESELPTVKMHRGQLSEVRFGDVDVQRLALVDEGAAVGSHLEDGLLRNLPNGFVKRFQLGRQMEIL